MAIAITNSLVDTRISGKTPTMTRVTDIDGGDIPNADSQTLIEFNVTADSTRLWMSYEQINHQEIITDTYNKALGVAAACQALETEIDAASALINGTYTQATYSAAIAALGKIMETRAFD